MKRSAPSERGIALVITLIMLSIITVVTVAFLALSRRDRAAVAQSTTQTIAEMAGEAGQERAVAQILAHVLNTNADHHLLGPDLFVSLAESNALNQLQYDPWVPVFANTNRSGMNGPLDDRTFLDLNRNGGFDPSGFLPWLDNYGNPVAGTSGPLEGWFVGDPMWIGVLEHPDRPHAPDNRFVARYCFIGIPAGRTLDVNYIHNSVLETNLANNFIGYFRNQGYGTWEMNLAGFLADLNTNYWGGVAGYNFNPDPAGRSAGAAFNDARDVLSYRLSPIGSVLLNPQPRYPAVMMLRNLPSAPQNFVNDGIDNFGAAAPVPLGRYFATDPDSAIGPMPVVANEPWPGSGDRRHLFSVHDYFVLGSGRGLQGLSTRLNAAGRQADSYDRYTFYRMLAQLGTDSVPEPEEGRINLNYDNSWTNRAGQVEYVSGLATNLEPWSPAVINGSEQATLFLDIADKLLSTDVVLTNLYLSFSTNAIVGLRYPRKLPIFLNGSNTMPAVAGGVLTNQPIYSPRVHQLLQMAANIYEATQKEKKGETPPYYPTVFRPQFEQVGNNIFITNYVVDADFSSITNRPYRRIDAPNNLVPTVNPDDNIYGIPLLIGAKKGYPNFNELALMTVVQASRKLEFRKRDFSDSRPFETNHMFIIGVSNQFGVEAWNSYSNAYQRDLRMIVGTVSETIVTNETEGWGVSSNFTAGTNMIVNANSWNGREFRIPAIQHQIVLPNSVFYAGPPARIEPVSFGNVFERNQASYTNAWKLTVRTRLLYYLVDTDPKGGGNRIVDAVSISGFETRFDITDELSRSSRPGDDFWNARPWRNATEGVRQQINVSLGQGNIGNDWSSFGGLDPVFGNDRVKAIDAFRVFMGLTPLVYPTNQLPPPTAIMHAPFQPVKKMFQTTTWEVNDPLVHYTLADLQDATNNTSVEVYSAGTPVTLTGTHLGKKNPRYRPWGYSAVDPLAFESTIRDPGVRSPDDWEFPEQKFPNIGWLGRVHRGTPWQTIYLKARVAGPDQWLFTGGGPSWTWDTHPTNDWRLLDLFTTAPHPNATRGQLSVNQTNLAAWSAVFSGIRVATLIESNTAVGALAAPDDRVMAPAAIDPALATIVEGINRRRDQFPNRMFRSLSDFISTPELTDESPYLKSPFVPQFAVDRKFTDESTITDFELERIPSQILSLIKVGEPRFVIYAWGQALQPAPRSIVTSSGGPLPFGICTNYQVTGEVATRAVVRIDLDPNRLDPTITDPADPRSFVRPRAVTESFNILPNE